MVLNLEVPEDEIISRLENRRVHVASGRVYHLIWNPPKEDGKDDQFLKIVKNITSKGFVRSNYEEKLVDLSDVRINLKTKN